MARYHASTQDERTGVQAVETGLRVLTAFIGAEAQPMLKTIAERAHMHPAKVHRYLVSLSRFGFVQQDPQTGRYRLGEGALQFGYAALGTVDTTAAARPLMQELRERQRCSVVLGLWTRGGATIAVTEVEPTPITIVPRVGCVLPVLGSATGRIFGTWLPRGLTQDFVQQELDEAQRRPADGVPRNPQEVEALFAHIRDRGLARVTGQSHPAVHALSAPVFDGAGASAAVLSVVGPADRFDADWDGAPARALRDCAQRLSRALGWMPKACSC